MACPGFCFCFPFSLVASGCGVGVVCPVIAETLADMLVLVPGLKIAYLYRYSLLFTSIATILARGQADLEFDHQVMLLTPFTTASDSLVLRGFPYQNYDIIRTTRFILGYLLKVSLRQIYKKYI